MTFYRIGLVNLYSYLATELFGGERVSMSRMVESIMHLRATIEERATTKKVILEYNKKEPDMMRRLEKAIDKINNLASKTLDGKRYQFALESTDSHLFSSA